MAFDSREYQWSDLSLTLGGEDITGIRAVKYKESAEREAIYAKGREPHSIQTGNIAYEGEITMLQSSFEYLKKTGDGSVLALALDGLFSYGDPNGEGEIMSDRARGIQFTEGERELNQGDKMMEVTLPFICLGIKPAA